MQHVRFDHDPQRQLLQVPELRDDIRLRLMSPAGCIYRSGLTPLLGLEAARRSLAQEGLFGAIVGMWVPDCRWPLLCTRRPKPTDSDNLRRAACRWVP